MSFHKHNDNTLENFARRIIVEYNSSLLHEPQAIPVEAIMEQKYGLTIVYHHIRRNGRVLGETIFEDAMVPIYENNNKEGYKLIFVKAGTVIIDTRIVKNKKDGRYTWTCGHEQE